MIVAIGTDGKKRTYKGTTSTELNFALSHGGTIDLEKNVTYSILDSLLLHSDTALNGNGATLKLAAGLPIWGGRNVPISKEKAMLMISESSAKNIGVNNVTVDGSQSDYYQNIKLGTSCYNMATIIGADGIAFRKCTFKNGCNDAMLFNRCKNVFVDTVTVNKCGHDGVYTYYVDGITVRNCTFINRTNSSVRFYNVTAGSCINNSMSTSGGGFTGVELQGNLKNVMISGNYIKGLPYPGIVSLDAKMTKVVIEHNIIEKCKAPGISAPGAIIRDNIIR